MAKFIRGQLEQRYRVYCVTNDGEIVDSGVEGTRRIAMSAAAAAVMQYDYKSSYVVRLEYVKKYTRESRRLELIRERREQERRNKLSGLQPTDVGRVDVRPREAEEGREDEAGSVADTEESPSS